jgi:tetratricopeptide (TPR) repeat protein
MENSTKNTETFNKFIAFSIAMVTLLGAILAFMQADAAARDDRANRDSKRYSLEGFGRQISGDSKALFDVNAYKLLYQLELQKTAAENRGDNLAAKRFTTMASEILKFSPILSAPYYDSKAQDSPPNFERYESEFYVVEITELQENFLVASDLKEAWDYKANTYIKHITLLAVALFLLGLSTTIAKANTRWLFAGSGIIFTIIAVSWAAITWVKPVFDLRENGISIPNFAKGVGLSYQEKYKEAISAFDKAIEAYPEYANALAERADANLALKNYAAAAADYEKARAAGDKRSYIAGNLAWTYYLLGRFDDSINMSRTALEMNPDELWIRFQLAISLLVSGKTDAAKEEYTRGMAFASKQVMETDAAGKEVSSYLWWGLEDGANSLDDLIVRLDSSSGEPPLEKISNPQEIKAVGENIIKSLKSYAIALEYTNKPPQSNLTAKIDKLQFAEPIYNDKDEITDYNPPSDSFQQGLSELAVTFNYEGMKDGSTYILKLFVNGEEDPSWRIVEPWKLGASGTAKIPLSYGYSENFDFAPGEYAVELYVDWQLVQRGSFTVGE